MVTVLLALALVQQQAQVVTRVVVEPANPKISIGDTVRLRAIAYDAAGQLVPGAVVRWLQSGGQFEGGIDSTGLVTGGATGTIVATAMVRPAGSARPIVTVAEITVLPLPASRVALEPEISSMVVGQSLTIRATPFASNDDQRSDPVTWTSDNPKVLSVSASGRVTANQVGQGTVVAQVGRIERPLRITVSANPVRSLVIAPSRTKARTGDVIRFTVTGQSAAGTSSGRLTPEWSITPGNAQIDPDGAFVADLPGTYQVFAWFAGRTVEALVDVEPRVKLARQATVVVDPDLVGVHRAG